ncbi:MAG: site-specific DNA-methyltransferase [Candidatus Cloacimonetes bacterium]|nr:site-specific DNA-methyltransferase [Candidatus Cloacimonadota bacterium]
MHTEPNDLMDIREATNLASDYLGKKVTTSNITYLIQYGRIKKFGDNGDTQISKSELIEYYKTHRNTKENHWKSKLGHDLNWTLSFDNYTEAETTKHVHRLHPYKGKFIPQLVEYFLDNHIDNFKHDVFFKAGDIVLDPFCGSGTTLVQANELGLNAIGIDVSYFNSLISNCKIAKYDILDIQREINRISRLLRLFISDTQVNAFEDELMAELYSFNLKHFPVPDYKYKLRHRKIEEKAYSKDKEMEFQPIFDALVKKYNIRMKQDHENAFLDKWYTPQIRSETQLVKDEINKISNDNTRNILSIILSRTIRSCRATTHSDLATLVDPVFTTYYCHKHGKICKPLFSTLKWWFTYTKDTVKRIVDFNKLRTETYQICLTGDSRNIDIVSELNQSNPELKDVFQKRKINGIFSSPPYVGLIDYHEQHAYSYELFGFNRHDELEIGPLYKGQGREAKDSYVQGISEVLINCTQYMVDDYDVFLVANDKYNLYPIIAEKSGMKIVNQYTRPVLNRTEKDKTAYSESIFHIKRKI